MVWLEADSYMGDMAYCTHTSPLMPMLGHQRPRQSSVCELSGSQRGDAFTKPTFECACKTACIACAGMPRLQSVRTLPSDHTSRRAPACAGAAGAQLDDKVVQCKGGAVEGGDLQRLRALHGAVLPGVPRAAHTHRWQSGVSPVRRALFPLPGGSITRGVSWHILRRAFCGIQ